MIFLSHNKADKELASKIAKLLIQEGENVWFDAWEIRPGDSLIGGIGKGIENAQIFILIWSSMAAKSNWVGTEVRAILRRRVDDNTLRIIPIMLDDTPLPVLVTDYRGFKIDDQSNLSEIANEICGKKSDREIIRILQEKIEQVAGEPAISAYGYTYYVCPRCGSKNLTGQQDTDYENDRNYFTVCCKDCHWSEGGEI